MHSVEMQLLDTYGRLTSDSFYALVMRGELLVDVPVAGARPQHAHRSRSVVRARNYDPSMSKVDPYMRIERIEIGGETVWAALFPDRSGGYELEDEEAAEALRERGPGYRHAFWD